MGCLQQQGGLGRCTMVCLHQEPSQMQLQVDHITIVAVLCMSGPVGWALQHYIRVQLQARRTLPSSGSTCIIVS